MTNKTAIREDRGYAGHLSMFAANVIWGLNAPIGKVVLSSGITALSLTTFRMAGAAAAFWFVSLFMRREHVTPADMIRLFFAAMFGVILNQGSFIFGLSLTSPIDASIVTTTTPIITMIVAALYLREPVTGKKIAGILIGAVGALTLILGGNGSSGGSSSIAGDLLVLTAQISFAIYLTVFRDIIRKYSPVTVMKWMLTYASVCFIPFSYGDIAAIDLHSLPMRVVWCTLFVVFGATFLSYMLMMTAQRTMRPTLVSMYNYVQPVVATVVAVAAGMDTFGPAKWLAVALVFTGVFIVTRSKSRAQLDAECASTGETDRHKP